MFQGLRRQGTEGPGLSHPCLRAGDAKCLLLRFFFFLILTEEGKKLKAPTIFKLKPLPSRGKSKISRPLKF